MTAARLPGYSAELQMGPEQHRTSRSGGNHAIFLIFFGVGEANMVSFPGQGWQFELPSVL